jgi:hypothetical protein
MFGEWRETNKTMKFSTVAKTIYDSRDSWLFYHEYLVRSSRDCDSELSLRAANAASTSASSAREHSDLLFFFRPGDQCYNFILFSPKIWRKFGENFRRKIWRKFSPKIVIIDHRVQCYDLYFLAIMKTFRQQLFPWYMYRYVYICVMNCYVWVQNWSRVASYETNQGSMIGSAFSLKKWYGNLFILINCHKVAYFFGEYF